jgi:hypothetical protein
MSDLADVNRAERTLAHNLGNDSESFGEGGVVPAAVPGRGTVYVNQFSLPNFSVSRTTASRTVSVAAWPGYLTRKF